ncbi:MAG: energy transducer TonB [Pseudomonadota bacterium]
MKSEPRLAWATPSSAVGPDPVPRLSRADARESLWALALSVIVHAGLLAGIGSIVLVARDRGESPTIEVGIVGAAPEQPEAMPPSEPAAAPSTETAATEAAPVETKPEQTAPVAEAPSAPELPPSEGEQQRAQPAASESPTKSAEKPSPPMPETAKSHEAPPQTAAARPPAPPSRGAEGTARATPHDANAVPNVKAVVTPAPEYPQVALQYKEEGTVYLTVKIGVDGTPTEVTLYKSSGFGSLDETAIKTMRQWRFAPVLKNGRPEAVTIYVPMEFRLKRHDG